MCGITGYYHLSENIHTLVNLQRMNDSIYHRGPDEEGTFVAERVGLAMRRLSIIDLTTGQQPMHNETNTVHVVFNGEIYNYRELRTQLQAEGHIFTTQSDTEVLVHGYEAWGADLPKYLRGMFAFAIWDSEHERLMLSRDHFGIKPLYYTIVGQTLLFASEIKALLTHPDVSRELDISAFDQYLSIRYVPEPNTIFQNIKSLPMGHSLFATDTIDIQPYWQFTPLQNPYQSKNEALQAIQEVVADSVKGMLVSDVPLGAFLSGGIDSASIVAMMRRYSNGNPVCTFSIGFGKAERYWSELEAAKSIANYYGTQHQEFLVEPDVINLLPQVIQGFDQPFANPTAILLNILSEQTRQHVTVALTGTGGDEMFGGYVRYKGMVYHQRYSRVPKPLRQLIAQLAKNIRDTTDGRMVTQRLRRFFTSGVLPFDDAYINIISMLDNTRRRNLYTPKIYEKIKNQDCWGYLRQYLNDGNYTPLERLMLTEVQTYLPFNQLVYGDRMSMARSLELRVPLVDQKVIEVASNIPFDWKLSNGVTKGLFREAMSPFLPPDILKAPKQGFVLPIALWLRHELRDWAFGILAPEKIRQRGYFQPDTVQTILREHDSGKRDNSILIWTLIVFELWHEAYLDNIS